MKKNYKDWQFRRKLFKDIPKDVQRELGEQLNKSVSYTSRGFEILHISHGNDVDAVSDDMVNGMIRTKNSVGPKHYLKHGKSLLKLIKDEKIKEAVLKKLKEQDSDLYQKLVEEN
jgi:hypothetical protein